MNSRELSSSTPSSEIPRAFRRVIFTAGTIALVAGCKPQEKAPPPPPPTVQVLTVQPQEAPITQTWVATVKGYINADIRAQVSGYLMSQNYRNGAYVKGGDVLFQIDPRPFQAVLAQAQGSLAQAQAQNTANELNAQRSTDLYKKKVISQQQYDDQIQSFEASKAAVQAAQAQVQQAQLNLNFTNITSPVTGLASIATAQVGDLVGPSSGTLATVVQVDPIKVMFMVPEQDYVKFIDKYFDDPSKSPIGTNKPPNLPLSLVLAGGMPFNKPGVVTGVNNVIGAETGSISVEGQFPNPGNLLRPGQFGLVTATMSKEQAYVVPQRAVIDLQGIKMLAIVGADNKVEVRTVTLGPTMGSDRIVTAGLNPNDRVIIEGVQKVKQGSTVNPTPYVETAQEKSSDIAAPVATPAAKD